MKHGMKLSDKSINILLVIFTVCLFAAILMWRVPFGFRLISAQVRYGYTIPVITIFTMYVLLNKVKSNISYGLIFLFTMLICALALSGTWVVARSTGVTFNGLIPAIDSQNYYQDALRLLNGGQASSIQSRRPIVSGLIASLLFIGNFNIMVVQAAFAAIFGIALTLAILASRKRLGVLGVSLFAVLVFLFTRVYSGELWSEPLAIPLGLLAFALIFYIEKYPKFIYLFLFMLVLTQNIRPGAVLAPFVLALDLMVNARAYGFLKGWITTSRVVAVIAIGFILNFLFVHILASPDTVPFSNFAYLLYGLARDGAGWSQILTDHPEIFRLAESEQTRAILELVMGLIREKPFVFLSAILKQYYLLVNPFNLRKSLFAFAQSETYWISIITQLILWFWFVIGSISIVKKVKSDGFSRLIFVLFIGFLISIPLAPIQDFTHLRAYAATMPFLLVIPALGLRQFEDKFFGEESTSILSGTQEKSFLVYLLGSQLLLLTLTLITPFVLFYIGKNRIIPPPMCQAGQSGVTINFRQGSSLHVRDENDIFLDWVPDVHLTVFKKGIRSQPVPDLFPFTDAVRDEVYFTIVIDLNTNEDYYILIDSEIIKTDGQYHVCGTAHQYPDTFFKESFSKLFIAESVSLVR